MQTEIANVVSLYAVERADGSYFAGYDANNKKALIVATPLAAKMFSNKYDIKLRPDEKLVEIKIDLAKANAVISESFRPHRRKVEVATA